MKTLRFEVSVVACIVLVVIFGCSDRGPGPSRPYGADIFVRGNLFEGDEAESWSVCDDRNRLARIGDYNYELAISLKARTYSFKIGDKSWKAVNLGAQGSGETLTPGQPVGLTFSDSAGNVELVITRDGTYKFSLDAENRQHPILAVAQTSDSTR